MSRWLRQHRRAIALALRRLVRNPVASTLSCLVIGMSLSLPAGLYRVVGDVGSLARSGGSDPRITLFLAADAQPADIQGIQDRLRDVAEVTDVRYISSDEALRELKASTGLTDVLSTLEKNPLPPTFVVRAARATPETLEGLRGLFSNWPRVDLVQLDGAWARRLSALVAFAHRVVLIVGGVLGVALVSVIVNTVRLQLLAGHEEVEVMKLIGAADAYIRRPFLYFGMVQGVLGAAVGVGLVILAVQVLNQSAAELLDLYALDFRLQGPSLTECGILAGIGAALGWIGAYLSVAVFVHRLKPR